MGNPGAVVAVARLPLLVRPNFRDSRPVRLRVITNRYLRRHTADGVGAATVAGLDHEQRVAAQEMRSHRDLAAIGQHALGVLAELLNES